MNIDRLQATEFDAEVWSAQDIREQWPEDADQVPDDQIGVVIKSSGGDGLLLEGTGAQIRARLSEIIDLLP